MKQLTRGRALFPQGLMDCQAESCFLSSAEAERAVALRWMTVKGIALRGRTLLIEPCSHNTLINWFFLVYHPLLGGNMSSGEIF